MGPRQQKGGPNRRADASHVPPVFALIIFAKAPIPGQVKTRLCPPLTPDEAASLHGSIVLDMLERSRGTASMDRFVACAPSPDHVFFKILAERYGVRLIAQTGDDLGAARCRESFTPSRSSERISGARRCPVVLFLDGTREFQLHACRAANDQAIGSREWAGRSWAFPAERAP